MTAIGKTEEFAAKMVGVVIVGMEFESIAETTVGNEIVMEAAAVDPPIARIEADTWVGLDLLDQFDLVVDAWKGDQMAPPCLH